MNPSASGWIKKLLKETHNAECIKNLSVEAFYSHLKHTGFIYGSNIDIVANCSSKHDLISEELCKVNLLLAFKYIHHIQHTDINFIDSIIDFYHVVDNYKTSFLEELLGKKDAFGILEDIINKRVLIDDNLITKNFNYFITNALLFVDVLGYQYFLKDKTNTKEYLKNLEAAIETIILKVFQSKNNLSQYDQSLIKLIETSLRYNNQQTPKYQDVIEHINTPLCKYYMIDISCMAFWSDKIIDQYEYNFLEKLGEDLQVKPDIIKQSIKDLDQFYKDNKDKIALLNSKNMVQSFYVNSSKMVSKLIKRNSKRLLKELSESKDVMLLLTQSTTRQLTDEELKRVQNQLLDIFKSIPSLAIFMLPGGMLLLPLFIKFIPKLLPSAFDDNRIEDENEEESLN